MNENNLVFTFYSTHLALEFERKLKAAALEVKIIPVPRQISSSCGLAGRIVEKDLSAAKSICSENDLEYEEIYKFKDQKYSSLGN